MMPRIRVLIILRPKGRCRTRQAVRAEASLLLGQIESSESQLKLVDPHRPRSRALDFPAIPFHFLRRSVLPQTWQLCDCPIPCTSGGRLCCFY